MWEFLLKTIKWLAKLYLLFIILLIVIILFTFACFLPIVVVLNTGINFFYSFYLLSPVMLALGIFLLEIFTRIIEWRF